MIEVGPKILATFKSARFLETQVLNCFSLFFVIYAHSLHLILLHVVPLEKARFSFYVRLFATRWASLSGISAKMFSGSRFTLEICLVVRYCFVV
jgi:hypothetical protein